MPSSFRVPSLIRTRRSLNHLRSFHLSPSAAEAAPSLRPETFHVTNGGADTLLTHTARRPIPANLAVPLHSTTLVTIAIIASLFFIISISFAFLGADVEDPYFRTTLDTVAESSPGVRSAFLSLIHAHLRVNQIVLIGESVDVDVDEPSITIRWSILACGPEYVLPESTGVHGSDVCGLLSLPLRIFVDK